MRTRRKRIDNTARILMVITTVAVNIVLLFIIFGLFSKSRPIFEHHNILKLVFSSEWFPLRGCFGLFNFIFGTFIVTALSIIIAAPLCILTSIYLSEYASKRILYWAKLFIDLLAGIPAVVYGVWGILVIVPVIRDYIAPFFSRTTTGYSLLAGGIVLSIMVSPIIISVLLEIFASIEAELKESSLALGATKWQTIKFVILKKSFSGIISGIILGVSRALGGTMAVLMVTGNVAIIPESIFEPIYTIPSLIANNYGEMLSIPLYDSALMFAGFILLLIILVFNIASRLMLMKYHRMT